MALRVLAAVRFAATASLLVGCSPSTPQDVAPPSDAGAHATSASLTPQQAAQVLARVGDRTITLGDYVAAIEHMDQFDRIRYQSPARRKELLNEMVNVELLAHEAETKGYDQDPVAQQELRAVLRDAMLAEARKGAPNPADIPEAEVRAYYDAHKADHRDPERRRLSLIVLKDETAAKDALAAAAKTTTAAEWGDLVRTRSTDTQAKADVPVDLAGDFGFVSPPGDPRNENPRVPEEVRVAAYEIAKPNDVLDRYVKAQGKFWLVRLTQKTEPHERTFEEAQRTIRVQLAQERVRAKERDVLDGLRTRFPVRVDEAALARVRVEISDAGLAAAFDAGVVPKPAPSDGHP